MPLYTLFNLVCDIINSLKQILSILQLHLTSERTNDKTHKADVLFIIFSMFPFNVSILRHKQLYAKDQLFFYTHCITNILTI